MVYAALNQNQNTHTQTLELYRTNSPKIRIQIDNKKSTFESNTYAFSSFHRRKPKIITAELICGWNTIVCGMAERDHFHRKCELFALITRDKNQSKTAFSTAKMRKKKITSKKHTAVASFCSSKIDLKEKTFEFVWSKSMPLSLEPA